MEIHQFATSLTYGDAISDEMMEIQKILREKGYASEIFTKFYEPRMAQFARDYREYKKISSPQNVVIFHFSIGSPVSKMFFRIPDRKIMIYHNITPHDFFVDYQRILSRECYKGRLEIKLFVDKVDLGLGDSEFNRRALEEVGFSNTGVLPLLLNFSKFDEEGDPVTHRVFCNGKATILFVGRVIPNKKFEDVIKVFYFYKKYFNPNSQLLLVGDYRGMERYLDVLESLIGRLKLTDVYFTGHVEFSELVSFYRLAHIYLSMSEHEGFGVPLLESFYMRVPVVAYAAGAVKETMNRGGVVLSEKDFSRIAALMDMINRDSQLKEKIIASQLEALKKYRKERVSQILLSHIERVISG
ncbi:MAG: glycosyltransferase family 4 protein [Candidatus Aminicenantes bacterium]|nr:MAG: glycosyltransferase family 4 protein [Candidatus Aminicenantes bacterium]